MDCTVSVLDLVCLPNSSRSEQCVNTVICVCFLHQVWVCVCVPGSEHKHTEWTKNWDIWRDVT